MQGSLDLFGLSISTYVLWAVIGAVAGVVLGWFRIEKYKLTTLELVYFAITGGAGLFVGARFMGIISEIPKMIEKADWEFTKSVLISGPIVFYGGILGMLACMYLFARTKGFNAHDVMNWATPSFPFFHVFGRVACFYSGCCFGAEASWGIILPEVDGIPRIPVQLYEAGFNLIITAALLVYEYIRTKKGKDYNLLPIYFSLYAPFRFIIEFFRGDEIRGTFGFLSTSQWVSLIIIGYIVYYYINEFKKKKKKLEAEAIAAVETDEHLV